MKRISIAIRIQGIKGCLGYGLNPGQIADWIPNAIAVIPSQSSSIIDIESGAFTGSSLSVQLNGHEHLRELLLYQAVNPISKLQSGISANQTSITLTNSFTSGELDSIYIMDETMRVTAINGPNITVARAQYNTSNRAYGAGSLVFRAPSYWRRRIVRMFEYIDGVERQVWIGLLDQPASTSDDGGMINLNCIHPLSLGSDLVIGGDEAVAYNAATGFSLPLSSPFLATSKFLTSRYAIKVRESMYIATFDASSRSHRLIGTPIALANALGLDTVTFTNDNGETVTQRVLLAEHGDDIFPTSKDTVMRVLAVTARDAKIGTVHNFSPLGDAYYPFHPLTIVASILFSTASPLNNRDTFDLLNAPYALGLNWMSNTATFQQWHDLIEQTSDLTIDTFIAGWKGEESFLDAALGLMTIYGFAFSVTEDGSLSVVQIKTPSVSDRSKRALKPYSDLTVVKCPRVGSNDKIIVETGFFPPVPAAVNSVTLNAFVGSNRTSAQGETTTIRVNHLDMSEYSSRILGRSLSFAARRYKGYPTLKLRVDGTDRIQLGAVYRLTNIQSLESRIFITPQGKATNDIETDAFTGQVIEMLKLTETQSYEVTIALTAWPIDQLVRLRGPSATVLSINVSGNSATLTMVMEDLGQFAPNPSASYAVGQQVEAWTSDGLRRTTGVGVITAVAASSITISPVPTGIIATDVIRLTQFPTYTLDPRDFAYIAVGDRYE